MDTGLATSTISSLVSDIGDVLGEGLVVVFTLIGVLIGLFFMVRLIRNYISRGRG